MRTTLILGGLVLILALVVGAGFYLNYFNVRTTTSPDNSRTEISLSVDKQKVKDDLKAVEERAEKLKEGVKEKAGELKEGAKTLVLGPSVKGVILDVDAGKGTLTVMDNDKLEQMTFRIAPDTKIHINGKDAAAADLKAGDVVTVVHAAEQGREVAKTVTVDRG